MKNNYEELFIATYKWLEKKEIQFEPGLKDQEINRVECHYQFKFPHELKWFLQNRLPFGEDFPNWRIIDDKLDFIMSHIEHGILFDMINNVFWWDSWGEKPAEFEEAKLIAIQELKKVPVMIPIYGHCFVPSVISEEFCPVFSIIQTDIIHRGRDITECLDYCFQDWFNFTDQQEYIYNELYPVYHPDYPYIPFWTDLTKWNNSF